MREYKIVKTDLGYNMYKKKEKDGFTQVRFYGGKFNWTTNRDHAKTFFHKEDALSALSVIKYKDEQNSD